jgi:hypothetical protein
MEIKNSKGKNIITVTVAKAVAIFATAVLASAGGSAWASYNIARTVPFRVQALENDIVSLKLEHKHFVDSIGSVSTDIAVTKNDVQTIKDALLEVRNTLREWRLE